MDAPVPAPAELARLLEHRDWLRSLARRLVGESAADDLVQETWMAAMRRPPDPERPVRPWLAGVARRLAQMRARGEGRRARRQRTAAKRDELPSTVELIEGVDTQRRLAQEVQQLTEPYRTTVLLRYFHDLSAAEIARRQGVPAGTVRWRLKRGLDELRERLDREWGQRGAWCLALWPLAEGEELTSGGALASTLTGLLGSMWLRAASVAVALSALALLLNTVLRGGGEEVLLRPELTLALSAGDAPAPGDDAPVLEQRSRTNAAPVRWTLSVVEADGAPLAHSAAVLFDAEGGVRALESDGQGRLELDPTPGPCVLWIERPGAFVARIELELEGDLRVELDPGEVFAGRVELDERAPEPTALALDYDRLIYPEAIPAQVRAHLSPCRRAYATSAADGSFSFHGLPAGWSGELWTPPGLVAVALDGAPVAPTARLHVDAARRGARVQVAPLPRVRGVVTRAGERAQGVLVRALLDYGSRQPQHLDATSGADGSFELRPDRAGLLGIRLELEGERSGARERRAVDGLALGQTLDLGILAFIQPGAQLALRVLGPDGLPVAGARARTLPDGEPSAPSDGDGALDLALGDDTLEIEIGGAGWRTERRGVTSRVGVLTVSLVAVGSVDLTVIDPGGASLDGLRVRILSEDELFEAGEPSQLRDLAGQVRGRTAQAWRAITDRQGRLELEGLRAGVTFEVEVLDGLGRPVGRGRFVSPTGDQRLTEVLELDAALGDLKGIAKDPDGNVLVGVEVSLFGRGRALEHRSDGAGEFVLAGIGPALFDLELRKRGFAPLRLEGWTPGAGAGQHEFELTVGRDLLLTLEDELGDPVEDGRLSARLGGLIWIAEEVAPGLLRLEDLPEGPVVLELIVGDSEFAPVDSLQGQQRFRLPRDDDD